ncbi:crossover junction endodeoxyribonuclease RuvC [Candidatus Obscuribacterales bacterium]|nr:crossover junction endodeoxyribonuclease RuvC [Candidatus Obscuribacterales bacterium]MBX3149115.1 crossover junction endodeoxyribonuclease RuvC [Candidatus Obscuribacterales bacterium]
MSTHRILGIDPGTAAVGFGVVDKREGDSYRYITSGVISTPKTMSNPQRLAMIRADMITLLDEYKPDVVAVEAIFFFKNAKTLVPVSQARGVILESAATGGYDIAEYTPMQVKLCLTGHGRADKSFVQTAVAKLLNLSQIIKPDDANDAIAIAVCHARMDVSSAVRAALRTNAEVQKQ